MIETVTYGELKSGDRVNVQGYWFQVEAPRVAKRAGERDGVHGEPLRADVIRFQGWIMDADSPLKGTGYNGGVYGGYADLPIAREVRYCPACAAIQPWGQSCSCRDNGGE